jgi:hypothetical protein
LDQRLAPLRDPEADVSPAALLPDTLASPEPGAETATERPLGINDVAEAEVMIVRRERTPLNAFEPMPAKAAPVPEPRSAETVRAPPPGAQGATRPLFAAEEAEVVIVRRPLPGRPS